MKRELNSFHNMLNKRIVGYSIETIRNAQHQILRLDFDDESFIKILTPVKAERRGHTVKLKIYSGYGGDKPLWSWCCHGPVTRIGTHFESSCCDPTVGYNNPIYKCDFCGKECNESVAPVSEVPARGHIVEINPLDHEPQTK